MTSLSPTETKTSKSLDPNLLRLILIRYERNKNIYDAAERSLDPNIAPLFFKSFTAGNDKVLIYGNPILMSGTSQLFANLIKEAIKEAGSNFPAVQLGNSTAEAKTSTEPLLLAPGLSLEPYPEAFLSVWLYINGFASDGEYFMMFPSESLEHDIARCLRMWDWMKYFITDHTTLAFSQYVDVLAEYILRYLLKTNPRLSEGMSIHETKFPDKFKDSIRDIHESLKEWAANDELYITRASETNGVNSLFRFVLGDSTHFSHGGFFAEFSDRTFGYPNWELTQRMQETHDAEADDVKRGLDINRALWHSLGPAPYPKNYEYFLPRFYPNVTFSQNSALWDRWGALDMRSGPIASVYPEGSYKAGESAIVFDIPEDYPADELDNEREYQGFNINPDTDLSDVIVQAAGSEE